MENGSFYTFAFFRWHCPQAIGFMEQVASNDLPLLVLVDGGLGPLDRAVPGSNPWYLDFIIITKMTKWMGPLIACGAALVASGGTDWKWTG